MGLIEVFNLRASDVLRNRVTAACWKAAEDIRNEETSQANHAARLQWARMAFEDDGNGVFTLKVFRAVLQNATVQVRGEEATDDDIQWCVNGLIDLFAIA